MDRLADFLAHLEHGRNVSEHTRLAYESDLDQFGRWLADRGARSVKQVGPAEIKRYAAELLGKEYARTTVARKMSAVRTFFRYLLDEQFVDSDPTTFLRLAKERRSLPRALGSSEIGRLLGAPVGADFVAVRDRAALELLYSAGLRNAELVGLAVEDVDLREGLARVLGKGRRERLAVVGSHAIRALEDYLPLREAKARPKAGRRLFLNHFGTPLTSRSLCRMLERYLVRADLPTGTTPHTLRHTFATHLLEGGASIREVQDLLGHKHLSSTQIYTHLSPEHLRKVYEAAHPRARARSARRRGA
jgi:integrase/recombinase XerC